MTDNNKNTSDGSTKTRMLTSKENKKALENLNDKFLELMNDRGILASFLMSPLSKVTNPENTSQFKLVKDSNSNRVNDLLIHNTKPVTCNYNLLTFRDTGKLFDLKGDFLKMITHENYNVDLASIVDKKIIVWFCKRNKYR